MYKKHNDMRKVIVDLAVSLDGFIEGPRGETDWCIMEEDMDFDGFLSGIDTLFYGRVSYDAWGNFLPGSDAAEADVRFWKNIHARQKYVFTHQDRTDDKAVFIATDIAGKVKEMKQQLGKDIWLYGGAGLIKTFIRLNLIDVYRLSIHPIALGSGKPLFEDLQQRMPLTRIDTRTFRSGVVQLIYKPA
jgi:dihydrofolate reductase